MSKKLTLITLLSIVVTVLVYYSVTLLTIVVTVLAYYLSLLVGKRYPSPFTNPVFFSTMCIALIFTLSGISFESYEPTKEILTFLLGPATVALAVPLFKNRHLILSNTLCIVGPIVVGSLSTMLTIVALASMLGFSDVMIASMSVKSSTTPVAVDIAQIIHGDPALAAAFVVLTGIIGMVLGPLLLDLFKIKNAIARGLSLGTIAHGIGTAQAATENELSGAVAGIGMVLGAIFTSFAAPVVMALMI